MKWADGSDSAQAHGRAESTARPTPNGIAPAPDGTVAACLFMPKTSLISSQEYINDATLRELRKRAAATGKPFREVVEENLQRGLAADGKHRKRRRVRIKPHRLGLKAGFRGVSLNQIYDQIEAERDAQTP